MQQFACGRGRGMIKVGRVRKVKKVKKVRKVRREWR